MTMKRINILYDGIHYSLASRDLDQLKAEVLSGMTSGEPFWLRVNHGEGSWREADILISPGVGISLMGIDPPDSADD
ncbi:MAG TPA: hypothetical protein VGP24_16800 [Glaciihabitans sp.]|jgi:hypothetical protein|nr:hypothetical protein [Glaciihabitans sp.]